MNKEQEKGAEQNVKGRIKEAAGILTGNKKREAEGTGDRAAGALKKAFGDVKQNVATKLDRNDTGRRR